MKSKAVIIIIVLSLLTFLGLAFSKIGRADPLTDEQELAFRSIGYMDFLATPFQTTPYEWFSNKPWWAGWSFHDHPPLVFAAEHIVFRIFGDSLPALRFPFALFGFGAVVGLYLVAKKLLGIAGGLAALALACGNVYLLWLSRTGLQEGPVLFFLIWAIYFLIQAKTNRRWFLAWAAMAGLGLLTKYTAFIIFPVSVIYLYYFNRPAFRHKHFYIGVAVAAVCFVPVVVYNLSMYAAVGHFDLQFSSVLHQTVREWPVLPGKEIGGMTHRLAGIYPGLWQNAGPVFVTGYLAGLVLLVYQFFTKRKIAKPRELEVFLLASIALVHGLVLLVGPSQRFLSLLIPWMLFIVAYFAREIFSKANSRYRLIVVGIFSAVFLYQGFYSYQTLLAGTPLGTAPLAFSQLRLESSEWGYGKLENYLHEVLDSRRPAVKLQLSDNLKFIEAFRQRNFRNTTGAPAQANLVVYDPRINQVAKLWLYDRRYYYDGWPFVSADDYRQVLGISPQYFQSLGITDYYYIAATNDLFTAGNFIPSAEAEKFNEALEKAGRVPEKTIVAPDGKIVFRIYHFNNKL